MPTVQSLAIDGHGLACKLQLKLLYTFGQTLLKLFGIQLGTQVAERIVRRHTAGQLEKLLETVNVGIGEPLNIRPTVGSTDRAALSAANYVEQIVVVSSVFS